jgi:predicted small secreted protein
MNVIINVYKRRSITFKLLLLCVISSGLSSCNTMQIHAAGDDVEENNDTALIQVERSAMTSQGKAIKIKDKRYPCKPDYSPPIQDKTKIIEMLKKSGKITVEMTDLQKNKIVDEFINNKFNHKNSA